MLRTLFTCFKIPELRNKMLFTIGMLAIYRVGFWVPLPGVWQEEMLKHFSAQQGSAMGDLASYFALFTGGNLSQSTIFGLGIMPYISASIIFQLLATVVPALEKLQKEGEAGRKKIQEYTRYATVVLCLVQGSFWLKYLAASNLVITGINPYQFWFMGLLAMTTGTVFLMWLGEQIDEYGIGNGISLIITGGILARMPSAVAMVAEQWSLDVTAGGSGSVGPGKIVFLVVSFVLIVAGAITITQGQRRLPIQQQKMTRGRRQYGGLRTYLPLRVNHGGVMPIIFAQSLMMFPSLLFEQLAKATNWGWTWFLYESFSFGSFPYVMMYIVMLYFFAYFWTTVQFQPKEIANQLRDNGHFIPGLRPGRRTAEYLERVMERITYVGAGFLAVIAIIPQVFASQLDIPFEISTFLGGTGLLIVVSVLLDLVTRIEAQLTMRNYEGFLGDEGVGRIKGAYT